jgi:hypothetical protein
VCVRTCIVSEYRFAIQGYHESSGKPRPKDDKFFGHGIQSDPIYAVWGSPTNKSTGHNSVVP